MNQLCKVCGEPAAGFHFGAFTCEGCKSFFGRTYNNISAIAGCKNNGDCVINKKNRTACKACRLRKCLLVGMSKSGSRYGRRSNWFKIHCLLQEQQSHHGAPSPGGSAGGGSDALGGGSVSGSGAIRTNFEQLARLQQIQARQTYQDKTNPCIKTASMSPTMGLSAASLSQQAAAVAAAAATAQQHHHQQHEQDSQRLPPHYLNAAKLLNGVASETKSESRLSAATPSDSGASSAGDAADDSQSNKSSRTERSNQSRVTAPTRDNGLKQQSEREEDEEVVGLHRERLQPRIDFSHDLHESRQHQFLHIFRSESEPLHTFAPTKSAFASFGVSHLQQPPLSSRAPPMNQFLSASLKTLAFRNAPNEHTSIGEETQHEPIDLSLRTRAALSRQSGESQTTSTAADDESDDRLQPETQGSDVIARPAPLDLTLVRTPSLTG